MEGALLYPFFFCFSTNADKTRYIGALCGLGWNSDTQKSVLPDHDIELAFDVKFDFEDITEVMAKIYEAYVMKSNSKSV